jgi:methylmalonyl-CoA/ethylmalonyl-CoA epimerase
MAKPLISHIGIAVADLEQAINCYRLLTGQDKPVLEEVPDQKVKVAIFSGRSNGGSIKAGRIELVAATAPDSPIARFIAKRGEGLHHVGVYVDDLEKKLSELKAAGIKLIDKTPRPGAAGEKIAFVHPFGMHGVLIELLEAPKP